MITLVTFDWLRAVPPYPVYRGGGRRSFGIGIDFSLPPEVPVVTRDTGPAGCKVRDATSLCVHRRVRGAPVAETNRGGRESKREVGKRILIAALAAPCVQLASTTPSRRVHVRVSSDVRIFQRASQIRRHYQERTIFRSDDLSCEQSFLGVILIERHAEMSRCFIREL